MKFVARFCYLIIVLPLVSFAQNKHPNSLLLVRDTAVLIPLQKLGVEFSSSISNIHSAYVPDASLSQVLDYQKKGLLHIDYNQTIIQPSNDIERELTGVNQLQNNPPVQVQDYSPLDGTGVIIGIVDIGFQCDHPTFFSAKTGRTRISRFWQQNADFGQAPAGFQYGTEITDTNLIKIHNDLDGSHGTHVGGIAAGSGISSVDRRYRGVAPEAELVFVSIDYGNDTLGGSSLGDYVAANSHIIDAYKYIFDYAQSVGKPAVINLSWGMHTGPHDGTSLFDMAVDSLLTVPGRAIVGSCGNSGDNNIHLYSVLKQDTVSTMAIEEYRQFRSDESIYTDMWGSAHSEFSVRVVVRDSSLAVVSSIPFVSSAKDTILNFHVFSGLDTLKVNYTIQSSYFANNKPNIRLMVDNPNPRKYGIFFDITSLNSNVHAWNSGGVKRWTSGLFSNGWGKWSQIPGLKGGDAAYTAGENGGTSKSVITVGGVAARSQYTDVNSELHNDSNYVIPPQLVPFSSKGPTVDNRIKPDICAPAYMVPSAFNNRQFAPWMIGSTVEKSVFRNDTQYWNTSNGTSMAAPHVTGIVALMFQINPMESGHVRRILTETSTRETFMGAIPNNRYGYGTVNAYDAILETVRFTNLKETKTEQLFFIYPNPSSQELNLISDLYDAQYKIVGINGQVALTGTCSSSGTTHIDTQNLSPGVYTITLESGGQLLHRKWIKTD